MAGLTDRNRRAIDLYLGREEEFLGNGTACWQAVYGTRSRSTAAASWSRMLRNDEARGYLERHQKVLEDERAERIAYEQAEAVRDFLAVHDAAMAMVKRGRVLRKVKRKDPETGEELQEVEYVDVQGMRDPGEALRAVEGAIRVQGKHPDQKGRGAGMNGNVQIEDTRPADEPIDVTSGNGAQDYSQADGSPAKSAKALPKVVWIPRHASTLEQKNEVGSFEQVAPAVILGRPSAEKSPSGG
jgi:hypothetical protein